MLEGKSHVFGDHINTDYIAPSRVKGQYTNLDDMVPHLMEDIRPGFYGQIQPGDFIVGGINFGCGSSRETAPWLIKKAGIACVIAKGFARIFFRNAINIGLPVMILKTHSITDGDRLRLDITKGSVENLNQNKSMQSKPIPEFVQGILAAGGVINYLQRHGRFIT